MDRGIASPARRRLGAVLVEAGVVTPEQLRQALERQASAPGPRRRLGQVIVDLGLATERAVAQGLATSLGLGHVDLGRHPPAPDVVRLLPRTVAERARALVLDRTPTGLLVATSDPTNVLALDDVRLSTRTANLTVVVATDTQIGEQLARAWALDGRSAGDGGGASPDENEDAPGRAVTGASDAAAPADDGPAVRLVHRMMADAVRVGASDVHLEPQGGVLRIRFRVDGLLRDVVDVPRRLAGSVVSRIKVTCGLDLAERRVPQDGRARFVVDGQAVDVRVSTLPSLHGETVVLRLLARGEAVPPLSALGLLPEQARALSAALEAPQGLVLITGPTGSGKTNTLYSAIGRLNDPSRNIVTIEDPVEVQVPGITQVGIATRAGLTFSAGLRSVLRQDPDVVLVGEVRDGETAELALSAAMTGHLVLTTLHTTSAVAAMTRLVDMGVEPFLVATSLTAVVAQRLVRRPCPGCALPAAPDPATVALLGLAPADLRDARLVHGAGCPDCGGTGYRGRTGVFEVVTVDAAVRRVLLREPTEAALVARVRAAGTPSLRTAAVAAARRGTTTLEEVLRVTQADRAGGSGCPCCDRPVEAGMVACPWCTRDLTSGGCPGCGRAVDPQWRTCPWCAGRLT